MKERPNPYMRLILTERASVLMTWLSNSKELILLTQFITKLDSSLLCHSSAFKWQKGPSFLLFLSLFSVPHQNCWFSITGIVSWGLTFMHLSQRRFKQDKGDPKTIGSPKLAMHWLHLGRVFMQNILSRLRHAKVEYLVKDYTKYIVIQIYKLLYRQIFLTFAVWEV